MRVFAWTTARTAKHTYEKNVKMSKMSSYITVVTAVTSLSMVTDNIFKIVDSMDDLEIAIWIWRSRLNLEFRIEFGNADFTFGDCDLDLEIATWIWRSRFGFGDRD